jgi:hypothetical protein
MTLNTNQTSGPGGSITLNTGTNGGVTIVAAGTGNITLTTGTGAVSISGITYPTSRGTNGYLLATDGIGGTSWVSTSTLGIPPTYTLSTATGSVLGGVKIGSGVTAASDGTISVASNNNDSVAVYSTGTGAIIVQPTDGTVRYMTLTGNITMNSSNLFTGATSGQTVTFILTQDATGGRTLTPTGIKFAGSYATLSTTASTIDILTVSYLNGTYYATLQKAFA